MSTLPLWPRANIIGGVIVDDDFPGTFANRNGHNGLVAGRINHGNGIIHAVAGVKT
jgi:hypothetical protein